MPNDTTTGPGTASLVQNTPPAITGRAGRVPGYASWRLQGASLSWKKCPPSRGVEPCANRGNPDGGATAAARSLDKYVSSEEEEDDEESKDEDWA